MSSQHHHHPNPLLSSKVLIALAAIPMIGLSMLDGVNTHEITALVVMFGLALVIGHQADRMRNIADRIERRLLDEDGK